MEREKRSCGERFYINEPGRLPCSAVLPVLRLPIFNFLDINNKSEPISDWIKVRIILFWWSGPRENAPGGLRLRAQPEDEDGPLDPHLAGRVRFTKDCVGCRGALLLQVGLRASWPRRFFSGTARRHRLGRRSRHGPSGPRRKCGVDEGSLCVRRPESIK